MVQEVTKEEFEALKSDLEAVKAEVELHKGLIDHIVLVLREHKIQNKIDIPTTEELLASLNEDEKEE